METKIRSYVLEYVLTLAQLTHWKVASSTSVHRMLRQRRLLSRLPFPFRGIFLTQASQPMSLSCWWIRYHTTWKQGLEWAGSAINGDDMGL